MGLWSGWPRAQVPQHPINSYRYISYIHSSNVKAYFVLTRDFDFEIHSIAGIYNKYSIIQPCTYKTYHAPKSSKIPIQSAIFD